MKHAPTVQGALFTATKRTNKAHLTLFWASTSHFRFSIGWGSPDRKHPTQDSGACASNLPVHPHHGTQSAKPLACRRVRYPASALSTYITVKAPSLPQQRNRHLSRPEWISLPGAREQSTVRFSWESSSQLAGRSSLWPSWLKLCLLCFGIFRCWDFALFLCWGTFGLFFGLESRSAFWRSNNLIYHWGN